MSNPGVALVTGAAGAIGGAICADLDRDGWPVVGLDRRAPDDRSLFREFIEVDMCDLEQLRAVVVDLSQREGVGALVNCAGITRVGNFLEQDAAHWQDLLAVNSQAVFTTCQAVLPGMIERGSGRIVQITSDSARSGAAGEAVYAASKAALVAFSKSVAQEVGRFGITVNCVSPGAIETPMSAPNRELLEKLTRRVPVKRLGQPEDVSVAVTFLCCDRAAYITGQVVSVGGGLTMVD